MSGTLRIGSGWALAAAFLVTSFSTYAERLSDIRNTKHNFSATVVPILPEGAQRNAAASSESQICAFCHTPHGATKAPKAPLWNRSLSAATYTPYTSGSLDAVDLDQPRAKSKLCLSCHDGTLALGQVNVLNRVENTKVDFTGPGIGPGDTIPEGHGALSGFTRRLGVDLTNDHPISFTFDSAQALRDGELYDPTAVPQVGERIRGERPNPTLPLEENRVECITCHDPHIRDTSGDNVKFLRVNRFQKGDPVDKKFDKDNDIICLACHDKAGWVGSAHANLSVATYQYEDAAAELREFPKGIQVWQAACLNCHDPHTVQGSRRLLREGTDGPVSVAANGARFKQGGESAIEEVCYACHSADGNTLRNQAMRPGFGVPDVKTDFTTMARHMPITSDDQQPASSREWGREVHNIGAGSGNRPNPTEGKDFVEDPQNLAARHVECTDCHNPHRVIRNRQFNDDTTVPATEGTHNHTEAQILAAGHSHHTNLASGVLRGISGVDPRVEGGGGGWASTEFGSNPVSFMVKRGDPGVGGSTDVSAGYVTREYQVCFKCHSNYAYGDNPPMLGDVKGATPPGTNALFQYTNQAMEYQSPSDHKGEGTSPTASGAFGDATSVGVSCRYIDDRTKQELDGLVDAAGNCVDYARNNHRAWHPVIDDTGRTTVQRNISSPNVWRTPFNMAVGVQTMYCTDCHGSDTDVNDGAVPRGGEQGNVWGPHGSDNDFLLKGPWDDQTGTLQPDGLCFRCHDYNYYGKQYPAGVSTGVTLESGFKRDSSIRTGGSCAGGAVANVNLHTGHAMQGVVQNFRCTYCHVAIPHGWKNKNFLANLNDVGPEAGLPKGTQLRTPNPQRVYEGPYYNGATLKVVNFQRSGEWTPASCGSAGPPGNGKRGVEWMNGSGGETCSNIP
ncbi:MAG TPA: hypothetical protein ENJ19_08810 [Gammaproteobacteria bacterium]|nr:hypothetical protein [Gammaproteobacteria bacterium]